jgi:hypothetical protein
MSNSRVVASLALVAQAAANHTFFSIGDWGGAALGSHYEVSEYAGKYYNEIERCRRRDTRKRGFIEKQYHHDERDLVI